MGIFNGAAPQVQTTSVSSTATQVFNAVNTSTDPSQVWDFSKDSNYTIVNYGPNVIHVGVASVTTTALAVPVGSQLTLMGPIVDVFAITASGLSEVAVGLASNAWTV